MLAAGASCVICRLTRAVRPALATRRPLSGVPIGGLRRKPYVTLAGLLGVLAWIGLWHTSRSFTPGGDSSETVGTRVGSDERSHMALLLLGTAASLSTAVSDVIVDAIVAEKSNADPTLARRLVNRRTCAQFSKWSEKKMEK